MEKIRVLIVDDHPLFRDGLRALLSSVADTEVVGEATGGDEAIGLAGSLQPDIILMDINMPGVNGIEATRRIVQASPHIGILVVTMFEDDDSVFAALRAGARGYVLKDMDDDEMTRAILAVGHGEAIFSPAIAERMIAFFSTPPVAPSPTFPELTDSERNVLRLMARGLKNDAIAVQLSLSPKTVRNYISTIFSKLQVDDRGQAIVRARDARLS